MTTGEATDRAAAGSGGDRDVWGEVIGQPAAVAILSRAARRDEVPHALLFLGPSGVGQREAACALAASLNCPQAAEGEACGACSTCRRITAGTHPVMQTFQPEGAAHVVGSVREEWIPTATRTAMEGRRKVLRVAEAGRMNEAAQNAFLKVLEEPPASVVWVLEADDEASLLETVVSRCRRVTFAPWSPRALGERAARLGIPEADRPALVRAALGSPRRLAALAEEGMAAARREHLGLVGRLLEEGPGCVVPLAAELDGWAKSRRKARRERARDELAAYQEAFGGEWPPGVRKRVERRLAREERQARQEALELFLDNLASYLRDLLLVQAGGGGGQMVNVDHREALRRDAGRVPTGVALTGLDAVFACRRALLAHGQPELHLRQLLLHIAIPLYRAA